MELEFVEYEVKKLVNTHKHVDGGWFWTKYSAHPYVGCRSGCEFCYLRGNRYLSNRDPGRFDTLIKVKMNAVERLQRELPRLTPDVINAGDWQQPAESRYRISRGMLEVVLEQGFPLLVIERSPYVLNDLDLLEEINRKTWVCVIFSMSNVDLVLKRAFEPRSPGIQRRLEAMQAIADKDILTGTALMPIMPFVGDDNQRLEDAIRATKDHGGAFVLGSGLTMDGAQAERTLAAAGSVDPASVEQWRAFYNWDQGENPQYVPPQDYHLKLSRRIRGLCEKHGVRSRIPRYIPDGPLKANKRIAERLFLKLYDLELENADQRRLWAYRRAAWTVDELESSLAAMYSEGGGEALMTLPGIGTRLAGLIASWLHAEPDLLHWQ